MSGRNIIEHLTGLVVVLGALAFILYAASVVRVTVKEGVEYMASFGRVGGLRAGSDVRMRGVKVGSVTRVYLDVRDYEARVMFSVRKDLSLPQDSEVYVASEGLSGSKFLNIVRGSDKNIMAAGDSILKTNDFQSIEDKVSRIIFLAAGSEGE